MRISERVLCLSAIGHHAGWPIRPLSIQTQSTPPQQSPATSTWPSPPMDSLPLLTGWLLVRNELPPKARSSAINVHVDPHLHLRTGQIDRSVQIAASGG